MFTIKVVHKDQSEDLYHSVVLVKRITPGSNPHIMGDTADGVLFTTANGQEMFPGYGGGDTVYVMNDYGKTIAHYQL